MPFKNSTGPNARFASGDLAVRVFLAFIVVATTGCFRDPKVVTFKTQKTHPTITLSLVESTASDIVLRVTMANHASQNFPVLRWNLPQSGELTSVLFSVARDGSQVSYGGKMVKRRVSESDYLVLKPGEQAAATIGLSQGYDVSQKGTYTIRYHAWNQFQDEQKVPVLVEMASDEFTVVRK